MKYSTFFLLFGLLVTYMPQNKKNKREEKRRQVAFLLRQNEKQQSLSGAVVSQDPLSEDLAAEYFQCSASWPSPKLAP
jgi:hypothetical protein